MISHRFEEVMDELGLEYIRRMDSDYPSIEEACEDMAGFALKHLGVK